MYETVIHIRGNNIVGRYEDAVTAAIAYNKAVDTLAANGIHKKYTKNYIQTLSSDEYKKMYENVVISKKISEYTT